ncbi:MAG: UDP-N-acetylmuramoyl-L-alanyl-D-glutamate--2,6-diaminopimelate ligase [Candidatus Binatia bacterium]
MQLKNLLEADEFEETHGSLDRTVDGLAYDSREVRRGYVFFAVRGLCADGHNFVAQAVERGAAAVVVERRVSVSQDVAYVRVRNVRSTMGKWAASFYDHPSRRMVLVGVTGTNGKTTITYLLESIFLAAGMSCGVIGTINYRYRDRISPAPYTTPESVDLQALLAKMARAGVQSLGMEVSSHALEMERVRGIEFDGGLFTNLSRDHLDFHEDMGRYFLTKARLFSDYLPESPKTRKFAVIHGDGPWGGQLLERVRRSSLEVVSYGLGSEWDIHVREFESDLDGVRGRIQVRDQILDFSTGLIGEANLENILGAVGVGFALGLPMSQISEGIALLDSVPGRLERIRNGLGITVLVDYAHTPDALERMLHALRPLTRGRLIALFGCGGDRDRGKRPLMGEIAARLTDLVVLTSDNPRTEEPVRIIEEVEEGIRKAGKKKFQISNFKSQNRGGDMGYYVEPDRRASIRLALRLARAGDLLLIAGKGHEDYQIMGQRRIRFDDREVVRQELGLRASS